MVEKTLAKSVKKVIKWGKGLSVFITKESRLFKWDDKTYVSVVAIRDDDGERIVIKKIDGV